MKQETIEQIRESRKAGKKYRQIARELNISVTAVIYNSSEENKKKRIKINMTWFNKLPKEKQKEIRRRNKDYIRRYLNNKYKTSEAFREKRKDYSKQYYRRTKKGKKEN